MNGVSRDHGAIPSYFPLVDILRGFAAISVIIIHVIHHTAWTSFRTTGLLSWFRQAESSVDLFFVISGFAIVYSAAPLLASPESIRSIC